MGYLWEKQVSLKLQCVRRSTNENLTLSNKVEYTTSCQICPISTLYGLCSVIQLTVFAHWFMMQKSDLKTQAGCQSLQHL